MTSCQISTSQLWCHVTPPYESPQVCGWSLSGQVWLNPRDLPAPENMRCGECASPLAFLVQLYCPLDHEDDAFHRCLYIFCCPKVQWDNSPSINSYVTGSVCMKHDVTWGDMIISGVITTSNASYRRPVQKVQAQRRYGVSFQEKTISTRTNLTTLRQWHQPGSRSGIDIIYDVICLSDASVCLLRSKG